MELIKSDDNEFIPAVQELSLDELYEMANEYGKVEIGGAFSGRSSAQIRLDFTGNDHVKIECKRSPEMKKNLYEVIQRAKLFKEFYKTL